MAAKSKVKPKQEEAKPKGFGIPNVADYIDVAAQMVADFFERRYQIKRRVEDIRKSILDMLYSVKRGFIVSIIEALFLSTALLALIVGVIMLLSRIIPLEFIFIGYGLIVSLIVLWRMKVRA
jgi:uncharacterized membrane protein